MFRPTRARAGRRRSCGAPGGRSPRQRRLGDHGLPMPGLEELEGRLLVAAHVGLEDRALGPHGRLLHHVAHVQRIGVARHHVRPAGVARRPGPEHVAHRADDVCLDLAQLRPLRERGIVERGQEGAQLVERALEPSCKRTASSVFLQIKQDALVILSCKHICSESAGRRRRLHPARHRRRQAALGVRERHEDLLLRSRPVSRSVPAGSTSS